MGGFYFQFTSLSRLREGLVQGLGDGRGRGRRRQGGKGGQTRKTSGVCTTLETSRGPKMGHSGRGTSRHTENEEGVPTRICSVGKVWVTRVGFRSNPPGRCIRTTWTRLSLEQCDWTLQG